ncbi:hypothetical protein [Campylobacter sp. CNRCH_2015_0338h]|uniref:hypothetical protein n=1 Tax=Campylobacter sp. CNRCH_2015_0338h TaxID=2911605 RepID=UPI0021E6BB1D|nr:hypothetical protein [Campylobacter sp. CNRCH_2015_0338h]MCV3472168.1 hypothetical protein [Campylobacter sp. CNRCH_2015_0338h]
MLPLILGGVALAATGYGIKNGTIKLKRMMFSKTTIKVLACKIIKKHTLQVIFTNLTQYSTKSRIL